MSAHDEEVTQEAARLTVELERTQTELSETKRSQEAAALHSADLEVCQPTINSAQTELLSFRLPLPPLTEKLG